MRLLQLFFIGLLVTTTVGCGGDDDSDGSDRDCSFDLISVTDIGDGDFRVRLENTSSISYFMVVNVIYSNGGVQRGDSGIGVAQDVTAGTTVDIETVNGDFLERGVDFDCAQLNIQITTPGTGTFCFDDRVGEDCY